MRISARMVGSTLAVGIAVGLAGAMLVFVDTSRASVQTAYEQRWSSVDLIVQTPGSVDDAALGKVQSARGVRAAASRMEIATVLPGLGHSSEVHVTVESLPAGTLRTVSGRLPERTGEAVVDAETARLHGLSIGRTISVTPLDVKIVGLVDSAGRRVREIGYIGLMTPDVLTAAGAFDNEDFGRTNHDTVREITVAAQPGQPVSEVRTSIRAALGNDTRFVTRDQLVARDVAGHDWHELTPYLALIAMLLLLAGWWIARALFPATSALAGVAAGLVGLAVATAAGAVAAHLSGTPGPVVVAPVTVAAVLVAAMGLTMLPDVAGARRARSAAGTR